MANPSPCSFNERTPAASHGPFSTADSTARVSLRYDTHALWTKGNARRLGEFGETQELTPAQEVAKKRTRRTVKQQRAIVGASLDVIKERRTMRPEARTAARDEAIKESKEKKAAAAAAKKSEKAKTAAQASKGQTSRGVSKQGAKGAQQKVAASGRR